MGIALRAAAATAFCVAVAACSHRAPPRDGATREAQKTTLRVENQRFSDMNIFVLSGGQRVRLGLATGSSTTKFTIPSSLVGGLTPLRFLADPVGGRQVPVSEEITVQPGDEVVLRIPPG